jgi:hypothetical protein
MPTPSLFVAGRRPPVPGEKRLSETKGTSSRKKNRAPAGNSNLATAAALIVRRSSSTRSFSNLA